MDGQVIFALDEQQSKKLSIWKEAINTIYGEYGLYTYSFRPITDGTVVTVTSDLVPDRILDLTNIDNR